MKKYLFLISFFATLIFVTSIDAFAAKPTAVFSLGTHPGGTHMMTIEASVNGTEGLFIFDTGGGITYTSPAFAKSVGCEPWGQITGFTLTGQRLDMPRCDGLSFDIDGQHLNAPISGVFDIGKFMPPNTPRIDGSIGLDVFVGKAVTLSLSQQTLSVESRGSMSERMKNGKEVPIRIVRECEGSALSVVVGVSTKKGMAWMELDSGNGGANVIGKHLAEIMGLDVEKKEQATKFEIAGGIPVEGQVRINPTLTMDGNIGTRFMIDWDLTLDLASGRAWLSRAKPLKS